MENETTGRENNATAGKIMENRATGRENKGK
jgi:hypothetical protein